MTTTNGIRRVTYKGNNKITELRTILQRESQTHNYINRQNQSRSRAHIENIFTYFIERMNSFINHSISIHVK